MANVSQMTERFFREVNPIVDYCKAHNMTFLEFSTMVNFSSAYIYRMCAYEYTPTVMIAKRIQDCTGIHWTWLLDKESYEEAIAQDKVPFLAAAKEYEKKYIQDREARRRKRDPNYVFPISK